MKFDDYRFRKGKYQIDKFSYMIINDFNQYIIDFEINLREKINSDAKFPVIFVNGLPRSGTTLLMQILANSFDLTYFDNLSARFWKAPLYGLLLSNTVIQERNISLRSFHGKTKEIEAPHEFAYFWHEIFRINEIDDFNLKEIEKLTDWIFLYSYLNKFTNLLHKPLLIKGIWPGYFTSKILNEMDNSYFIYIKRNPLDIAISLMNARIKYYQDINIWWSMFIPDMEIWAKKPWYEQIAAQVFYLEELFFNVEFTNHKRFLTIDYEDLCNNIYRNIDEISKFVDIKSKIVPHNINTNIKFKKGDRDFDDFDKLYSAMLKYYNSNELI